MPTFGEAYDKWFSEYYKDEIEKEVKATQEYIKKKVEESLEKDRKRMEEIRKRIDIEWEEAMVDAYKKMGLERRKKN